MDTLLLTRRDVQQSISMEMALDACEQAFAAHGRGETEMPPKVYLGLAHHDGDFRAMPAYVEGAAGVKWVNSHPENPHRHRLPAVMGMLILSDPATALPLAVMDATWLTSLRTGAAAAVASKHLANPSPATVSFIGCGVQARHVLEAHRAVFGEGFEVLAADVSRQAAEELAERAGGRAVSIQEAAHADIVCTTTPSRAPLVRAAWLRGGCHINAMGADAHGKQELEPRILREARLFVDDLGQASDSGEVNVPLAKGELHPDDIAGALGQVLAGRLAGRGAAEDVTVFDSTGLAVQDVALARRVYEAARDRGVGQPVRFI